MLRLISLLFALLPLEQAITSEINGPRMMRDLEYITRFDRISGGEGEARAVDYIIGQLQQAGIPYRVHEFESLLSWPGPASLEILAPESRNIHAITFSFARSTPPEGVVSEIVAARMEARDLNSLTADVRIDPTGLAGKIAFVDARAFPHVVRQVEDAGAAAAIFTAGGDLVTEGIGTVVWGTPSRANAGLIPAIRGDHQAKRRAVPEDAAVERHRPCPPENRRRHTMAPRSPAGRDHSRPGGRPFRARRQPHRCLAPRRHRRRSQQRHRS